MLNHRWYDIVQRLVIEAKKSIPYKNRYTGACIIFFCGFLDSNGIPQQGSCIYKSFLLEGGASSIMFVEESIKVPKTTTVNDFVTSFSKRCLDKKSGYFHATIISTRSELVLYQWTQVTKGDVLDYIRSVRDNF